MVSSEPDIYGYENNIRNNHLGRVSVWIRIYKFLKKGVNKHGNQWR
jgi:hypothetical protein